MAKPIIIYVSGAPGSGKTTLAKLLSEQLYIPHVSSDLIHGGTEFSSSDRNRKQTIDEAFVPLMVFMAQKQISFVVDQVLQKGLSESDIIVKLQPHATIILIHTQSNDPIGRYISRTQTSTIPNVIAHKELLLDRASHHRQNLKNTAEPLSLDIPTLVVNTDSGYSPTLNDIVTFIEEAKLSLNDTINS